MTEKLPSEILGNIATYLSRKDLCTCLRVCRSWNTALISALYNTIVIHSRSQFKRFCKTLRNTELHNPLGHLVRKIRILAYFSYRGNLFQLPKLCPFVTEIDFDQTWDPEDLVILPKFKHLTRIPCVAICESPSTPLDVFQKHITSLCITLYNYPEWIDLIPKLPCIEDLKVSFFDPETSHNSGYITLSNVEMLHNSLLHLRSLTMDSVSTHGDMPEHITPCDTIRSLSWTPVRSRLWGLYFARKYTNLKELHLNVSRFNDDVNEEVITLAKSCRHLESFFCHGYNTRPYVTHRDALKILHEIGAPLTSFSLHEWDYPTYAATVDSFHRTVSKIDLGKVTTMKIRKIIEPLKACLSLVHLELIYVRCDLEIDCILDNCKSLKVLDIVSQTIIVSNKPMAFNKHGLRTLKLSANEIEDSVFRHLSECCPRLAHLKCCYYFHNVEHSVIYLPNPSLKRLDIEHSYPVVYKLTQTGRTERIVERNRRYHGSIEGLEIKEWTRWYRLCQTQDSNELRRLKPWVLDNIPHQLRNNEKWWNIKESQDTDEHETAINNNDDECTISIICHSLDEVYLHNTCIY
ncbi:hypothetical protein DFQ30_010387 [Apophysomyces sp. BC1015]|nr:hypothetical protein DFQ30_010387 [Apophysomyces sp. BC1015]